MILIYDIIPYMLSYRIALSGGYK